MSRFISELVESIRIAVEQVNAHKMRSILTALGVIIGIVAVTMMGTAIKGIDKGFQNSLDMLGTDVFYVEKWPWRDVGDDWIKYRNRPNMQASYARELNEIIANTPNSKLFIAAPFVWSRQRLEYGDRDIDDVDTLGTNADARFIGTGDIAYGRGFTDAESVSGRNVAILGWDVANTLFPAGPEYAIGERIKIRRIKFEVIGVNERQGSFLGLQSFDKNAIIPLPALRKFFYNRWWDTTSIRVKANEGVDMEEAKQELIGAMRRVRALEPGEENDFEINQSDTIEDQLGPIKSGIAIAGFFVTGLALFVGAIGIMNITFVSVKERTREIGTRRALGARKRAILTQFLIEAVAICLIGGLLGLLASYGIKEWVARSAPDFPMVFSGDLIVFAVVVSVFTGIASGFAPALQAANLDPAEALRHE